MDINELFIDTQNNLIMIMHDLSVQMNNQSNYDKIDADLSTMNDLSNIVKRLGDTIVLAIPQAQPQNNEEGVNNK
jgi:hypothetical protein